VLALLNTLTWLPGFLKHESAGTWLFAATRVVLLAYVAPFLSLSQNFLVAVGNLIFVSLFHATALGMIVGGVSVNQLLRCCTICREAEFFKKRNLGYRVLFSLTMADIRTAREDVAVSWAQVGSNFALMSFGTVLLVALPPRFGDHPVMWIRHVALFGAFCGVTIYIDSFHRAIFGAAGMHLPGNYRGLFQQRSLAGVWSHWNRGTSLQLRTLVFEPLSRAGNFTFGAFATFAASAVMHLMPLIALHTDLSSVLGTLLFFVIQFPILLAERRMHLHGKLYLVTVLVLTLPVFIEFFGRPALKAIAEQ
jgi:hypothetical protein